MKRLVLFGLLLSMTPPVLAQNPASFSVDKSTLAERKERVHTYLLNIYIDQKRKPEAMAEYKNLPAMKPNDPKLNSELGKFEASSGQFALAISHLKKACDIDPDNKANWAALGAIYLKAKDYQKALEAYDRAGDQYKEIRNQTSLYLQHLRQKPGVKKPVAAPVKKQETDDDDW